MLGLGKGEDATPEALSRRVAARRSLKGPTEAGHDILLELDALRAPLVREREAIAADLERQLRALAVPPDDIGTVAARAKLAIRQVESRVTYDMAAARSRAEQARADVESFRRAQGLRRGAHTPDSKLLSTGLLIALTAVEAIASAPILADALRGGLVQGYLMGLTLSGLNAGIGFLGGYLGLRYLTQKRPVAFVLGLIGFAVSLFVGIFLNVFTALWRARTLEAETIAAAKRAAKTAAAKAELDLLYGQKSAFALLFDPDHGETVVLLTLGAIVLVAAYHKGFSAVDDPAPDYGKLERVARAAEEEFADARADVREDLEASIEEAKEAIQDSLDERREALKAMRLAFDGAAMDLAALERKRRALEDAAVAMLEQRGLAATPAAPAADPLAPAGAMLAAAEAALREAQEAAKAELEGLLTALDQASARLAGQAKS